MEEIYYGWIPILTHKLKPEKAVLDMQEIVKRFEDNTNDFLTKSSHLQYFDKDTRDSIRNNFGIDKDQRVFYSLLSSFDDVDHQKKMRLAFSVNQNNLIDNISILELVKFKEIIRSKILSITSKGLVTYQILIPLTYEERDIPNQIFALIRDIYHQHIYAVGTDLLLRPVMAANEQIAISEIFNQYQNKIIDYHSRIRHLLDEIKEKRATPRSMMEIYSRITCAKGEMVYALSFINLFNLGDQEKCSILNSIESFNTLLSQVTSYGNIETTKINNKMYWLTFIIFGLTFHMISKSIGWTIFFTLIFGLFLARHNSAKLSG